jgi:hypothetical protein
MAAAESRRVPILLWPFWALWRLVTGILALTGRLVAGVLGIALMAAGALLTVTVVGAPVGVPLAVLGLLLLIRALF